VTHTKQQKLYSSHQGSGYNTQFLLVCDEINIMLFCMCHATMGLTGCCKTAVFFYIFQSQTIAEILQRPHLENGGDMEILLPVSILNSFIVIGM